MLIRVYVNDFIWDFRKLPLGEYFNKIGKVSAKIHEIGNKLGIGQIKSLYVLIGSNMVSCLTLSFMSIHAKLHPQ